MPPAVTPSVEANLSVETWHVQALTKDHRRDNFDCGEPSLNDYLQKFVSQDAKRSLTRAFVLSRPTELQVMGYYTLSALSVHRDRFPGEQAKKLPRYPIPAVLLGRLAIDRSAQGKKLGEHLLIDALKRTATASATIGVYAMIVEALHERAAAYYANFGFITLQEQPLTLFMPMETILQLP
jgi:predicted N-acetyltransferase YhbS